MAETLMPFGRTLVTPEEPWEHVDEQDAVDAFQKLSVPAAPVKIDGVLSSLSTLLGWLEAYGRKYS
ncbi:hypothetical protein KI372_06875 [Halobacterium salinarum]|uniref:hypothetical protein n=1 Tax=Halobacterium salinarum TaxID=2242 RepID=UPI001F40FAB6|nr:hypothetical protein [Halobacterium salinarum]MCF2206949.1 hypothetical protein [Halobacterium salinarum]MCF2241104.1 hypothetical protein [Halobacterium salinarum]